jgi:F-type H+-transporting ATPase subunit b
MHVLRVLLCALLLSFAAAPTSSFAQGDEHAESSPGEDHGDDHGAAGEHHEAESPVPGLIRHTFNLLVLFGILFAVGKTPTMDFLHFRRSQVKEQLDASWTSKTAADKTYAELQGRLDNFDAELERLMSAVRGDAATERQSILDQAERSANQLEAAAKRTIEEELRRARTELRDQTVEIAIQMATDALAASVDASDQARLGSEYLTHLEEAAG